MRDGQEYPEHKLLRQTIDQVFRVLRNRGSWYAFPRRHNWRGGIESIDAYRLNTGRRPPGQQHTDQSLHTRLLRHSINISSVPDVAMP